MCHADKQHAHLANAEGESNAKAALEPVHHNREHSVEHCVQAVGNQ